ncbi:hypothetical protein JAAARDRAFT_43084 [Jaapia argillacea MUCL 33604]|uniref:DNA endonuclease activator Ctp1 C-terminal domain-containing protein n=1 Tax=Jaapia argillacea MUCL 33604 TaxID=933084 RepID=A0A067PDM4_9AGAM|nr:hypothetical protein JAAARDRAFT_43084 [Jaapia argillacea MUCL 33604]
MNRGTTDGDNVTGSDSETFETEMGDANRRLRRLATSFGFDSVEEAEAAALAQPDIFKRDFVQHLMSHVDALEAELKEQVEISRAAMIALQEPVRIARDGPGATLLCEATTFDGNAHRQSSLSDRGTESPCPPVSELAHLRVQIAQLQQRYDTLLQQKERAAARYKADYKKWRKFKDWLFQGDGFGKGFGRLQFEQVQGQKLSREAEQDPKSESGEVPTNGASVEHSTSDRREGMLPFQGAPMGRGEEQMSIYSSDTEDDSQAFLPMLSAQVRAAELVALAGPRDANAAGVATLKRKGSMSDTNAPPHCRPRLDPAKPVSHFEGMPKLPPKKIAAGSNDEKENCAGETCHVRDDGKSLRASPEMRTGQVRGNRKGQGRYAPVALRDVETTVNAVYQIDQGRNGGLGFQYDEVVRTREDRKRLNAGDCECCRDVRFAIYRRAR